MNKLEQAALVAPDGYALISIDALKAWGKYDEVRNACQFPVDQDKPLYRKVLREMLDAHEQTEQEPEVWYCPDCGTLSETQVKCCPDWIRSRKVPKNFALTCKATFDRNVQAEQEPVAIGSEWKPCMKLPVVVHVREQREGESHVSTREGITPVRPDDLIMRGVAGEEYPIGRELFNKTYTFDTAAPVQQAEQKPVGEVKILRMNTDDSKFHYVECQHLPEGTKLYAAPFNCKGKCCE